MGVPRKITTRTAIWSSNPASEYVFKIIRKKGLYGVLLWRSGLSTSVVVAVTWVLSLAWELWPALGAARKRGAVRRDLYPPISTVGFFSALKGGSTPSVQGWTNGWAEGASASNGTLSCLKKEGDSGTCSVMDGLRGHDAKGRKPVTKR